MTLPERTTMNLKQIALIHIAALSLSGSLYGMESNIYNGPMEEFLVSVNNEYKINQDDALKAAHINTRLGIAIENGNVNETREIIDEHKININQTLPSRITMKGFTHCPSWFIPLHKAVRSGQSEVIHLLVTELNADVTIKDEHGNNALHAYTGSGTYDLKIAQLLLSKNDNLNIANNDGKKPMDYINWLLDKKIQHDPEIIKNLQALKATVPTDGSSPWKWIGGGVAVVVVCVAAKKLYNWWHKDADAEEAEEKTETDAKKNEQQDTAKEKTATQA